MALKILLNGARGRMGLSIAQIAEEHSITITAACDTGDDPAQHVEKCSVIIDFSVREVTAGLAQLAADKKLPLVIGTTGHTDDVKQQIIDTVKTKIPVVWAGNFSVGVNTLNYLTGKAAKILAKDFDIEVMEMHHHHKRDAPSGTAERLIEILRDNCEIGKENVVHGREGIIGARPKKEIGVHAIRGGDIVGEHTVCFCGQGERVELTHRATDRRIFARGAIRAAQWVINKAPGVYNMEDVLGLVD